MQIRVAHDSLCGAVEIPAGDYLIALNAESHQIRLTGHGKDLLLPAIKRRSQCRGKFDSVSFASGGGSTWHLVILSPKLGEWVAMIDVNRRAGD